MRIKMKLRIKFDVDQYAVLIRQLNLVTWFSINASMGIRNRG